MPPIGQTLLLLALLVAAPAAQSAASDTQLLLVPSHRLQIALIGSTHASRRAYLIAARATIGRRFSTHLYTEADVPPCRACAREAREYHSGRYRLPFYNQQEGPFLHNGDGGPRHQAPASCE
jgi:hypothetical protein